MAQATNFCLKIATASRNLISIVARQRYTATLFQIYYYFSASVFLFQVPDCVGVSLNLSLFGVFRCNGHVNVGTLFEPYLVAVFVSQ